MGLKQELENAREAVGAALHNVNAVLTDLGMEPAVTVAALAQSITDVYNEGATILETSKTSNAILLNDSYESPLESLTVYGEAENPTVTVAGKNFLPPSPYPQSATKNGVSFTFEDDGRITASGTATAYAEMCLFGNNGIPTPFHLSAGTYTVGFVGKATGMLFSVRFDENNAIVSNHILPKTFTLTKPTNGITVYLKVGAGNTTDTDGYLQIERGSAVTEYEPYKGMQTVTIPYTLAEGDTVTLEKGVVNTNIGGVTTDITDTETGQALKSLHTYNPNTTIICDSNCTVGYRQDLRIKRNELNSFWDAYQNYGKRRNYQGGFSGEGWTVDTFKPKYDIVMELATDAFRFSRVKASLIDILQTQGVGLDFTDVQNFTSTFYNSDFTELPAILPNNPTYYSSTFNQMHYLEKIEKLRIVETTTFSGPFSGSSKLKELTIVGVIGNNKFTVADNKALTHDSLMSIINALKDYSDSGTTYTVTLGSTNLGKLTEAEKAIATEKGWTLA